MKKKVPFIIETALQNDGVEMRVEPQLVAECLVRDDHTGKELSARRLAVEVTEDVVDQTRHFGEQASIVAEERPECFGHRENELSMRQLE
jgi:hypothetical protein